MLPLGLMQQVMAKATDVTISSSSQIPLSIFLYFFLSFLSLSATSVKEFIVFFSRIQHELLRKFRV